MEKSDYSESFSKKNYFREIRKFDQLNADDQIDLVIAAKNGDEKARSKLIECNQRFIVSIAKQYRSNNLELQDLINEGNIGMIRAIDKFDENKDIKFLSYAVWWIRQSIMSSIYDNSETVRLPVNKINSQNKLNKAREVLTQELERDPTLEEMVDRACIEESEVACSGFDANKSISLSSKVHDDSDLYLSDCLHNDSHIQMENSINRDSLSTEINGIFNQLSDRESKILIMYYGLNGCEPKTLREIGDVLGLTNERVRQIKELSKRKLRGHSKSSRLKEYLNAEIN